MAPTDIVPNGAVRIVLIEEMVVALVKERSWKGF